MSGNRVPRRSSLRAPERVCAEQVQVVGQADESPGRNSALIPPVAAVRIKVVRPGPGARRTGKVTASRSWPS